MKKILYFFVFFSLIFASCEKEEKKEDTTSEPTEKKYNNCFYKVTGTSAQGFDVTYQNKTQGTEQKSNVTSGWTYSLDAKSGDFLYISAQANSQNATVTVQIYHGPTLLKESKSSGNYVIATADILLE